MLNPIDVKITKDDFDKNECQKILDEMSKGDYYSMHCAFVEVAQKAQEQKEYKREKIYQLIFKACSMMLSPNSPNAPFKPLIVSREGRTTIPEDFTEEEINFFSEIIPDITHIKLKARLADLVWMRNPKSGVASALTAIDVYCQLSLDDDEPAIVENLDCWQRAIRLAVMIKDGAGGRIEKMEQAVYAAFDSASIKNDVAFMLSNLMFSVNIGKNKAEEIAGKLESLARQLEKDESVYKARHYYEASIKWYDWAADNDGAHQAKIALVDNYVKGVKPLSKSTEKANSLEVAYCYEKAIQILRTIPKGQRGKYEIDKRISKLRKDLEEARRLSLGDMFTISSGGVDTSNFVTESKAAVTGKNATDALKAFANITQAMQIAEMQESAMREIQNHPLMSLCTQSIMSRDGRVCGRIKGIKVGENITADHDQVQKVVMDYHQISVGIAVQGFILPALAVLHLEHRIREIDFLAIAQQSPAVPPEREILFAKGLFAGYDRDYVTALHILVPQIENLVRYHLKRAGATTTTLDDSGVESVNGLNTLVELPDMKKVFGDDITFQIKALFCGPLGANFRNEIAHGIVDNYACQFPQGVYAWWFIFKLIFGMFLHEKERMNIPENGGGKEK